MIEITDVLVLFADLQTAIVARSKTNSPEALAQSAGVLAKLSKYFLFRPISVWFPKAKNRLKLVPELEKELPDAGFSVLGSPFADEKTKTALGRNAWTGQIEEAFGNYLVERAGVR